MKFFLIILFLSFLYGDGFMIKNPNADEFVYKKYDDKPKSIVFVTSYTVPINSTFLKKTPYGTMISIHDDILNSPFKYSNTKSRGMYLDGNYIILKSIDSIINFYHRAKANSNLYKDVAPKVYELTHFGGELYKAPNAFNVVSVIEKCSIIISKYYESSRIGNAELLLNLDDIPNKGIQSISLDCNKK